MTRRRWAAFAAAVCVALPFLLAGDARAEVPPAPHLTSTARDLGNGYGQTVWWDAEGNAYELGLEFRLPQAPAPPPTRGGGARGMVDHAAVVNRVSAAFLHCLADRESGHDPAAVNRRGNWHGMYQYLPSTWAGQSARYGFPGASVYDGWANAHVTAAAIAAHRGDFAWLRSQWPPSAYCGSPW